MGAEASKQEIITKEDMEHIHASWNLVMKNPEENGTFIFKSFLDKHNYYFKFHKLMGVPPDELATNKLFRKHASSIIHEINKIVNHVEKGINIKQELNALGKMHGKRKVTETQFQELKVVILDILKNNFKASARTLLAWNKTFELAFSFIFEGIRQEV